MEAHSDLSARETARHLEHLKASVERLTSAVSALPDLIPPDLTRELQLIKGSLHLTARTISPEPTRPLRVVFLVHSFAIWDAWVGIYDAMLKAPDFQPIIATIPRRFGDDAIGGEEAVHQVARQMALPHLRLGGDDSFASLEILKALQPDLLFRLNPYDEEMAPGFRTPELTFTRLCYVPYAYLVAGVEDVVLKLPYLSGCWRAFCTDEEHRKMIERYCPAADLNSVVTGYSKFDRLLEEAEKEGVWPISSPNPGSYRVIWAPHHSVCEYQFGTFVDIYREVLGWARENPDFEIVLKPHAQLFSRIRQYGLMNEEEIASFRGEWDALPNTALCEGETIYGPLFAASHAMVTDGISFLAEYQLFDRPLVWIDSGRHIGFSPAGEALRAGFHAVGGFGEAVGVLGRVLRGEDPLAEARRGIAKRLVPYPGRSTAQILDHIRKELGSRPSLALALA